jgi:gas vesicle protein
MIIFLVTVIFSMSICIVYLIMDFYKDKKVFESNIKALEEVILQILKKQISQSNQLKLSDNLNENLKKTRSTLNTAISNLNYDLFEILVKNNLLKK